MCNAVNITPRTYYRNRNSISKDDKDSSLIYDIFIESNKTYGYRRVCQALLEKYGIKMNHKKVARLMQKYEMVPKYIKRRRKSPVRRRVEANVKADLLKRNFTVDTPDKVWVTDITYLKFRNNMLYLSTIMDLYDRSIVAYTLHNFNNTELVESTLTSARLNRYDAKTVIIHSDQGFQYTSAEYQKKCRRFGFLISMSRKGTPLDNAVIESFHSRLKNEAIYHRKFNNLEEFKNAIFDWLWFYNHGRIKGKRKTIEYINFKEKYKK